MQDNAGRHMSRGEFLGICGAGTAALAFGASVFSAEEARAAARVENIAHRGASGTAPENTLAAIRRAVRLRADFVEVDVQRSSDGELILFHDATLTRTTNVEEVYPQRFPYRVGDFTFDELRRLDAGSWFSGEFAGERIPTLAEALPEMRGRAGLLLELKDPALYPGIERQIADELEAAGFSQPAPAAGRLVVQSFDHASVRRYHELQPRVAVGELYSRRPTGAELRAAATYARQVNPSYTFTDRSLVQSIHALGMSTSVYTVNEPEDMRRMISLGVDGIITDFPETLNRVRSGGRPV